MTVCRCELTTSVPCPVSKKIWSIFFRIRTNTTPGDRILTTQGAGSGESQALVQESANRQVLLQNSTLFYSLESVPLATELPPDTPVEQGGAKSLM